MATLVIGLVLPCLGVTAGTKWDKHINPKANPPQYAAFTQPLSKQEQLDHAVERLTFGPRPDDLERVRENGLDRWIDQQLHPERIPENPVLSERLRPFQALQLSIRQTYLGYPPQGLIAAVARGNRSLPDDPELRVVVNNLAARFREKKQATGNPADAGRTDAPQTEEVSRLTNIINRDDALTLRDGSPEQKRQVLASIPAGKRLDFVLALNPEERRKLFLFAPVTLRRELMFSVNPESVVAGDLTEGKLLRAIYSEHQLEELLVDFWFNHFNVFLDKGTDRYSLSSYERESIRPYVFGRFYDLLVATAQSPAMLFYLDNWQSVAPNAARQNAKNKRGLNENYGRELLELHTLGVDGGYTQKDVIEVARCFTGWTIAGPRKGGGFEYNDRVHDKGQKVVLGHVIKAGGGMNDGLEVLKILARQPATAHHICLQLAQRFAADDPPPSLVKRMEKTFLKRNGDLREVMRTMLDSPEFWSQGAYRSKVKTPFETVVSAMRASGADVVSAFALGGELHKLGEPLYLKVEPDGYSFRNSDWVSSSGLLERMNFAVAVAKNRIPGVKVNGNIDPMTIGSPDFQKH